MKEGDTLYEDRPAAIERGSKKIEKDRYARMRERSVAALGKHSWSTRFMRDPASAESECEKRLSPRR